MAEIKSTLEMVMERAAKIAAESEAKVVSDDTVKEGMRIAAAFLTKPEQSLSEQLAAKPQEQLPEMMSGIMKTLLRNIVLPQDDEPSEASIRALAAVKELSGANADVANICQELEQILNQYGQHKQQMIQQLEDALRGQLEQQAMMHGDEGSGGSVNPRTHPQYREELGKMLSDLRAQYSNALDERKRYISQQFA